MPLALALALLCCLGSGGWSCLHCDQSVLHALRQLREATVPKRFHLEGLQARAQALLLGMEGPFFRDYAVNAFVGKVGVCLGARGRGRGRGDCCVTRRPSWSAEEDQLEDVATSFKNQTRYIRTSSLTGRRPSGRPAGRLPCVAHKSGCLRGQVTCTESHRAKDVCGTPHLYDAHHKLRRPHTAVFLRFSDTTVFIIGAFVDSFLLKDYISQRPLQTTEVISAA